jgi:hypothetical protein
VVVAGVALLATLVLAGCSGGGNEGDGAEPLAQDGPDEASLLADNGTAAAAPATDTLWLSPDARLNASAVSNLTILATLSGAFPQTFGWNATLNGTGNLSAARLVLWLDLQNSALQPGVGGDPGCTAAMTLVLTLNGTATSQPGGCASLGTGSVPPGEHRLEFFTLLTSFPQGAVVAPGDGVVVQVAFGLSMPQGVGYLLAGPDHDSGLRLVGLREPVPAPSSA